MSDVVRQGSTEERRSFRILAILILVSILLPHTLDIAYANAMDNSYLQFTMFSTIWMLSLTTGSTIVGPFSSTSFEALTVQIQVFDILFLPVFLILIFAYWRFMKGSFSKKSIQRVIGLALIVQLFILFALFWYTLDGWAFAQSYPLPIIHILIVRAIRQQDDSVHPEIL